ncbi:MULTISPECIES: ClpXP protease specificity-enhancing factor [Chromohalobacter]|jgi:stringent starvation protein B|uniref:ClpXP protease specificity-enhancing factor n=1 Tax=Chromohalobacter TaxID=42054 RepID=UPI0005565921|nr:MULTISPECIES: ClpXP protease specificity-enhancing factor [Chromohalobacter]MDF9433480.1 ClpXP protease specificity-enhancing factor [Chromohalobacter israelensis]MDO0946300.1 ClpXP protease specificity-enhancing factor [Chromohalobacter salexigens]NQY46096.1 ClpXP protease specificity-enhancing factor [Chromohalobacter sp.]NWO56956.1 ClpXP protease specificity-enhancing factor [Chromohalobacter salexigens]RXE48635.1 stringent starvation protein B [Chromohalobacter salexigens]
MLSSRPYLARALYEWLLDNEQTPYIVVDAEQDGVSVPRQYVQNGQIVLNIAPSAVRDLYIENAAVTFGARFSGQPMQVIVPMEALIALYARENGVGMVFGHEPVMPEAENESTGEEAQEQEGSRPTLESVEAPSEEDADSGDQDDEAPRTKGRPSLRVVK